MANPFPNHDEPRTMNVGGHTVERLRYDDAYRFCCQDCAGHADDLDAYRHDDCEDLDEPVDDDDDDLDLSEVNEGDRFTVTYDSAHADEVQEKTGEVTDAGTSWNGGQYEVTFRNRDGFYRYSATLDGEHISLDRLQFNWSHGERTGLNGTKRIVDRLGEIHGVTVEEGEN